VGGGKIETYLQVAPVSIIEGMPPEKIG